MSFAYKFEGESVKSAFAYLINEKIILDYPVGGEKIFERTRQTIEWHNVDFKDPVIISFDDGTSWAEVTGGATPNTGEFEWLVPAVSDTLDSCRIMIEEAILNKPKDKSKWFSIIPLPSDTVIAALQFTDTLASTAMNMVSPLLSVEPRNAAGQLLPNLGEDVLLTLSSSSPSGEFSLQKYPFEPASHITLKSGRSRIQFYYRNYEAGLDTLSLAAPAELGWSAAQLPISVSNSIIVEAEDMQLSGMRIIQADSASGGNACLPNSPYGILSYEFFGKEGMYQIYAGFYDEPGEVSEGHFKIADRVNTVEWYYDKAQGDEGEWVEKLVTTVNLIPDDEFIIRVYPAGQEMALIDYIKLACIPDTIAPACQVYVTRPNAVDIEYSEPVMNWLDAASYSVEPGLGGIEIEQVTKQRVRLLFGEAQIPNAAYTLAIQNITDYESNALQQQSIKFTGFNTSIVYRVEAEHIPTRQNMEIAEWQGVSNDSVIQFYPWIGTGTYADVSFPFDFPSSEYKTYVAFYDEIDGQGEAKISSSTSGNINGWDWDQSGADAWRLMSWGANNPCQIDSGATISIRIWKDGDEMGVIDYVEFRDLVSDTIPPLAWLRVNSACQLEVAYSEEVSGWLTESNYSISPGLGALSVTKIAPSKVRLTSADLQQQGMDYTLTISNVQDLSGNFLSPDTCRFSGYAGNENDIYRVELESVSDLQNFIVADWAGRSNDQVVRIPESSPSGTQGVATFVFDFPSGLYRTKVAFYDETAGESVGRISTTVCGLVNSWNFDNSGADAWFLMDWGGGNPCYISTGDTVTLQITKDGDEMGAADYIEFAPESLEKNFAQEQMIPKQFDLHPNYPNPFNPATRIVYDVPRESLVSIKIYNIRGQLTATLVDEMKEPGRHQALWNGRRYGSGVYFYEMTAGDFRRVRKMLLVK